MKTILNNGQPLKYICNIRKMHRCSATHAAHILVKGNSNFSFEFYVNVNEYKNLDSHWHDDNPYNRILRREFKERGLV